MGCACEDCEQPPCATPVLEFDTYSFQRTTTVPPCGFLDGSGYSTSRTTTVTCGDCVSTTVETVVCNDGICEASSDTTTEGCVDCAWYVNAADGLSYTSYTVTWSGDYTGSATYSIDPETCEETSSGSVSYSYSQHICGPDEHMATFSVTYTLADGIWTYSWTDSNDCPFPDNCDPCSGSGTGGPSGGTPGGYTGLVETPECDTDISYGGSSVCGSCAFEISGDTDYPGTWDSAETDTLQECEDDGCCNSLNRYAKFRVAHDPTGTCYLKVWLQRKSYDVETTFLVSTTELTPYEWIGSGPVCLAAPAKAVTHADNRIIGAEDTIPVEANRRIEVTIKKWSCVEGYTPPDDGSANGYPAAA